MKLGASAWPFRWYAPFEPVLERVADLGLSAIELISWSPQMLRDHWSPDDVGRVRRLAEELGLEISEFIASSDDLAHPDPDRRDAAIAYVSDAVAVARDLGSKRFNSVAPYPFARPVAGIADDERSQSMTSPYEPGLDWRANWEAWVDSVTRVVERCEAVGVVWAIEPHPHRYVASRASMERLVDHVPSSALGVNLDVSHLAPMGEIPTAWIGAMPERIFHLHVSDNEGRVNRHWRPGRGKIDWDALFAALKAIDFDGVISIELEDAPGAAPLPPPSDPPMTESEDAAPEFDEEHRLAMTFLRDVAARHGIELE
jgi:sugar phosphate isomerase/epimerase